MTQAQRKPGVSDARLEWHLLGWAEWMEHGGGVRGFPSRSAGFVAGGNSTSFDDMIETADIAAARAVDAIIDGLAPIEQVAIHHAYLAAVWRSSRVNLAAVLGRAKGKIAAGLRARGFY